MANNLNIELKNKWVVLEKDYFKEGINPLDNLFFCEGGFGCSSFTSGRAIFGYFQNGEKTRIEGYEIRRLATEEEATKLNVIKELK